MSLAAPAARILEEASIKGLAKAMVKMPTATMVSKKVNPDTNFGIDLNPALKRHAKVGVGVNPLFLRLLFNINTAG